MGFATAGQSEGQYVLRLLDKLSLAQGGELAPDRVREWVRPATPVVPALAIPAVELASYDALLGELAR